MLSRLSGRDYYSLWGDLVLRPNGIKSGRKSSKWDAQGACGGWEISASDHLRFVVGEFTAQSSIGKNPGKWARVNAGGGASYGLGVLFRKSGRSYNFWQNGRHCYGSASNAGSFFASWAGEVAVAVMYNTRPNNRQQNELDVRLYNAAR